MHFVGLYCIIVLQRTVQKHIKIVQFLLGLFILL